MHNFSKKDVGSRIAAAANIAAIVLLALFRRSGSGKPVALLYTVV
jgi:hypothetical protein